MRDDMENLEMLDLSETAIEELPSSIGRLKALKHLNLGSCEELVSLSGSICKLSSLQSLYLAGCSKLKGFPEMKDNMENLERLDLRLTAIEELPSSIGHLKALKHLDLSCCKNLLNLPKSICNLSSLETLEVPDCPKLGRLNVNLRGGLCSLGSLGLTCCILKRGVIWSNNYFSSLKTLNLPCDQIEGGIFKHQICPLSSLVELFIRNSRRMERGILNDSFHLSSLEVLSIGDFNLMERGILNCIFHQSSLETLSLHNCNLMEEGIPGEIWNLSSLVELSLSNCNLTEGEILNHICHLSSLEELSLDGNHFSSIPAAINRLSNLRVLNLNHCKNLLKFPDLPTSLRGLNLNHCKKLQEIPELPSSLRFLDAHCSDGILSSPSLLSIHLLASCFKSELIQETEISVGDSDFQGKGMSTVIPRSSGILAGIRNQSTGSDEVTIELPQNWYENNDLLGFALCCVYVSVLDVDFDNGSLDFYCELTIRRNYQSEEVDKLSFQSWCDCYDDDDDSVSDLVWVIYYPKVSIKKQYHSSQWTHFVASFNWGITLKAEECGIHLVYNNCFECERNEQHQRKLCLKGHAQSSFSTNNWPHLLTKSTGFNVKTSRDDTEDHPKEDPHSKRPKHL